MPRTQTTLEVLVEPDRAPKSTFPHEWWAVYNAEARDCAPITARLGEFGEHVLRNYDKIPSEAQRTDDFVRFVNSVGRANLSDRLVRAHARRMYAPTLWQRIFG